MLTQQKTQASWLYWAVFLYIAGFLLCAFPYILSPSRFLFNEEFLLTQYDAYAWLMRADQKLDSQFLTILAKLIEKTTSLSSTTFAFWFPAVITPVSALILLVWGKIYKHTAAGIFAGFICMASPILLSRSSVGMYDTDCLVLVFVLLTGLLLGVWFRSHPDSRQQNSVSLLAILIIQIGVWIHQVVALVVILQIVVLMVLNWLQTPRSNLMTLKIILIALSGLLPVYGVLIWPFILVLHKLKVSHKTVLICLCSVGVLVGMLYYKTVAGLFSHYLLKTNSLILTPDSSLEFLSAFSNIAETKPISIVGLLELTTPSVVISILGLLAFIFLLPRYPLLALLLPQLLLWAISVFGGNRFVIFGVAPISLGFALGLWEIFRHQRLPSRKRVIQSAVMAICVFVVWTTTVTFKNDSIVTPVLSKEHVEALKQIDKQTNSNTLIWTWWDWGYATKYFTSASTFIDGGEKNGSSIAFLAKIYMSDHEADLLNWIKLANQADLDVRKIWNWLASNSSLNTPVLLPDSDSSALNVTQYLVVTWEDLSRAGTISEYANWNSKFAEPQAPYFHRVDYEWAVNFLKSPKQETNSGVEIGGYSLITTEGITDVELSNSQYHALINDITKECYVFDNAIYNSMLYKLLFEDVVHSDALTLVYNKVGSVRIFEVNLNKL